MKLFFRNQENINDHTCYVYIRIIIEIVQKKLEIEKSKRKILESTKLLIQTIYITVDPVQECPFFPECIRRSSNMSLKQTNLISNFRGQNLVASRTTSKSFHHFFSFKGTSQCEKKKDAMSQW